MKGKIHFVPLLCFLALAGFFIQRLVLIEKGNMPNDIPSVMIGKPAPDFNLPPLSRDKQGFKNSDLKGKVTLVSFFASWCVGCLAEHPLWPLLSGKGAVLAGIDYKDTTDKATNWLGKNGDYYDVVAADATGRTGIDFGVYGVPETYLVDKQGVIRYKQTGPLTPQIIEEKLLPMIRELNK